MADSPHITYSREDGDVFATLQVNVGIKVSLALLHELQTVEPQYREESAATLAMQILQDLSSEVGDLLLQQSKNVQHQPSTPILN